MKIINPCVIALTFMFFHSFDFTEGLKVVFVASAVQMPRFVFIFLNLFFFLFVLMIEKDDNLKLMTCNYHTDQEI